MANEAPAAVNHAHSDAMSVDPVSPMVSDAAVPEDEHQALQTPTPHLVDTSCLANKQQTYSLEKEETLPAITQPAGLALRNPQLPHPHVLDTSAAASLSTSPSIATAAKTHSAYAPAEESAAMSQPTATDHIHSDTPAATRAAASPSAPHVRGPAVPSRHPTPLIRSPAMPSRHAAPASTGAVRGQQASRRPGPAHCDADELWAAWHWGNGALQGASAPNMAQCASHPPHAPKKR